MSTTRTRFAPSPTGYLHVGGIRTALFAWLLARHDQGQFILRFEDTDQKREVAGAKEHLIESLNQLGLDYDEGPDKGGPFGPYSQSQRLDIYKDWAHKLIEQDRAYADPYTPDQVQNFRQQAQADKQPFLYRNHRPQSPPDWDGSTPLRFKADPKAYDWHDEVMGDRKSGPETIDDFVLIKSDGFPTYNFAHVVDDHTMQISHVLRGQEFLSSVPNYLNLYEALGIEPPKLATLPHIMAPDGKKKLSKRDGAKDVLDYIRAGYTVEALISFIATLGWNDGSQQEIFTRSELIYKFSLDRVQKSGAQFDENRLDWINGSLIRSMGLDELYDRVKTFWPEEASNHPEAYKKEVLGLVQERLKFFGELDELSRFFFIDLPLDKNLIKNNKKLNQLEPEALKELLQVSRDSLAESDFSLDDLIKRLNSLLEATNQKPAVLFSLIRIATTQVPASPSLAETLSVLGKDTSLRRIDQQLAAL